MGWTASEDNDKRTYVTYRIYASNQYPVDIQKAENLVANGVRKTEFLFQPEVPWHQRAYWAVTAVDRYGNESEALELNQPKLVDFLLINDELPEIPEGCTLIISNATGQEVLRTTQPAPDWKDSLKKVLPVDPPPSKRQQRTDRYPGTMKLLLTKDDGNE